MHYSIQRAENSRKAEVKKNRMECADRKKRSNNGQKDSGQTGKNA